MYRILLVLLFISAPARAQQDPIDVASDVENVTVFMQGAQVFRTASVSLPVGKSVLRIERLDPALNPESIQFNAGDALTVLSVSHNRNYLEPKIVSEESARIENIIKIKSDSVRWEESMIRVFDHEEAMLLANQSIGGSANGVELERLESATNFFRERLMEIARGKLAHRERIELLNKEIQALRQQLQAFIAERQPVFVSELFVTVQAPSAGRYDLTLNYLTRSASWRPLYDLRVTDIDSPLDLQYKAEIEQFTGEDWEDAQLVLSTADPTRGTIKPALQTRRVGFYNRRMQTRRTRSNSFSRAIPGARVSNPTVVRGRVTSESGDPLQGANVIVAESSNGVTTDRYGNYELELPAGSRTLRVSYVGFGLVQAPITSDYIDFILVEDMLGLDELVVTSQKAAGMPAADMAFEAEESIANMPAPPVQTRSNTTSIEFDIVEPYTIKSDDAPTLVDIAQHALDPVYEYYTAPVASEKAFLSARLTGWESLNLLSGTSNLFFNSTFLGQTFLDMENVSDTLDLSLGIDQGIVIDRKREEEFTKKQLLGNRKTDIYGFEIEVRNNKTVPVSIVIEDQIPVSSDNNISVELEEEGGAMFDEETGILKWVEVIEPASSITLNFRYSIRYPKGRTVRVY